jgi:hypothetical protein
MSTTDAARASELPHEAGSLSEILAATHLFVVKIESITASPWEPGPDGLEQQTAWMNLRLEHVLKGRLNLAPGATFTLAAPRRRENALMVSDYHGFWSHAEVAAGQERLVIAGGSGGDPAALMLEPSIRDLPDGALAGDVVAALALERSQAGDLAEGGAKAEAAALVDLSEVDRERARCHGLLGRYLWVRLDPVYAAHEMAIRSAALDIALAADTTPELRAAMVEGLFAATSALPPEPARRAALAGPLFRLLQLPANAISRDRLVQVVLFALVFGQGAQAGQGNEPISAAATIPDEAERSQVIAVLSAMSGERPSALAAWLRQA